MQVMVFPYILQSVVSCLAEKLAYWYHRLLAVRVLRRERQGQIWLIVPCVAGVLGQEPEDWDHYRDCYLD